MFTYTKKAQYHETDQMGIIHHANYVKWMEEARIAYLAELGFGYREMEAEHVFSPVVSIAVQYKTPVRFADEIAIQISVKEYTAVKLELAYEFFNQNTKQVCSTASSVHCFIKNGKIISLKREKPALHEKLSALAALK